MFAKSFSVLCFGFCLILSLSVSWLGGYVGYWVYVIVSWGLDLVLGLCVS